MIEDLRKEMVKYLDDIKQNIKDPEDLKYIVDRTDVFFDEMLKKIREIVIYKTKEVSELKETQKEHDKKIEELHERIKDIYEDFYEEEYDSFELTCPYCNYYFEAEIDESQKEITCPECKNPIELDWDE